MVLATWNPMREMERMRAIADEMMGNIPVGSRGVNARVASFPVSIAESEEDVVVKAALPGFAPEEIELSADRGRLMIHAHHADKPVDAVKPVYDEIWEGDLTRVVTLPQQLDYAAATASVELGVLTLRIPKSEEAKPMRIAVQSPIASLK